MPAARIFKLPTPYTEDEIFDLGYEQQADIAYLAHVAHDVMRLSRYGDADWTIAQVYWGSKTVRPTAGTATPSYTVTTGAVPVAHIYVVTAINDVTGQESLPSDDIPCGINDLNLAGNYNTVTWTQPTGCTLANVYKDVNGIRGFCGAVDTVKNGATFKDDNFSADLSDTPPGQRNPFDGDDNKPSRVTFFDGRLVMARTNLKPNGVFTSQPDDYENLNVSQPTKPSDAITFALAARKVQAVQHMLPMKRLLLGTPNLWWSVSGDSGVLTPSSTGLDPESYRGVSRVRPVLVDEIAFYNTNKGNQTRTLGYQFSSDGYRGNDVTVFANHLFDGFTTITMDWAEYPTATLWEVRSDGKLCALTWQAEQQVWGWSLCDTDGFVEDVAVITENGQDTPYFVVRRTVGDAQVRYIERLASPLWSDVAHSVYLDSSRSYDSDPATVFSLMDHLAGRTVTALADGVVYRDLVVSAAGTVTLPVAASVVTIGLPYTAWIHTLPIVETLQGVGVTKAKPQMVAGVYVSVLKTRGIEVAPGKPTAAENEATVTAEGSAFAWSAMVTARGDEPYGAGALGFTGNLHAALDVGDNAEATVVIRQRWPLPMTVTGVFPVMEPM